MSEISNAIKQICSEKGLGYNAVLETIEAALAAAYRKDFGQKSQNIKVEFDPETANIIVFDVKVVVEDMPPEEELTDEEKLQRLADEKEIITEEVAEDELKEVRKFNLKTEMQITDAKFIKKSAKVGDELKIPLDVPGDFGRMAAQTAKQVIIQKLREAERDMVFNEFKEKEHEVISGVIQRREGKMLLIDLGKTIGVLPPEEQIITENYKSGSRIKIFVKEVRMGSKGPEVILSRTSDEILKKIFYLEIPEISNGLIEIKAVAREAGSRSKVAVASESENVDPIGSCVGQRGARIQTIISELGGEKIDIIEYDSDPAVFIANSLSPAKVVDIKVNSKEKKSIVNVSADQFSLAIGKNGQNVRLAAHLTGWKIDIMEKKYKEEKVEEVPSEVSSDEAEVVEEQIAEVIMPVEEIEPVEEKAVKKLKKEKKEKAEKAEKTEKPVKEKKSKKTAKEE